MSAPLDAATAAQVRAARPDLSTWLTANAGSGKTRVLTDRVARLLLEGADPARILCLTYTKAAAAEMQVRLLNRLGEWAMLPEGDLRTQLSRLGTDAPDSAALGRARRLFARAIETPGGLKIQTIHAFCAALLRRFPLEAGVPHQFTELDDRSATLLRADILEAMATGPDRPALDALARLHSGDQIGGFLAQLAAQSAAFDPPLDRDGALAAMGLPAGFDQNALIAGVFLGSESALIAAMLPALMAGGTNDQKLGAALASINGDSPGPDDLITLEGALLTKTGANAGCAKIGAIPNKATREGPCAPHMDAFEALMGRVETARPHRLALATAERTAALHRFAGAFLARYNRAKAARGLLDFDDLISKSAALLSNPSVADWVLFRLDGGIDHVLVDEAQDTSPGQWTVIDRLTAEFTAGQGAHRTPPTLFVVGDRKQSIYSFQGADLEEFDRRRTQFAAAFEAIGRPMQDHMLAHSFRSAPAILSVVDQTFAPPHDTGLGGAPQHIAFHGTRPGRVDLWPAFAEAPAAAPEDYDAPVDTPAPERASARLARAIAARIRAMLDGGECLPGDKGITRPITEGDILILVQRRSDLFGALITACKQAGLAVAGADRVKLAAEIAVGDLRALLAFLATPEDDLSLAEALRSPLFALDEAALYALAQPRRGYLWEALRTRPDHPALPVLRDLRNQADYLRPYDLLERVLTRHRGRERLVARLGPEAEDGIDVLLAQALAYEQTEAPSLTGFLVWLAAGDLEVKRQAESGAGAIRVMTVHGAKGLESPIVFLPDCAQRSPGSRDKQLLIAPGQPALWRGAKPERPDAVQALVSHEEDRATRERARLLYVAMTRAESWLIVAAAGKVDEPSWHADIARGIATAGQTGITDEPGIATDLEGPVLRHAQGDWPAPAGSVTQTAPTASAPALPGWARRPLHAPPARPAPVLASTLGGGHSLPPAPIVDSETEPGSAQPSAGAEIMRAAALERGSALHLLLEHLPDADPADWPALAERLGIDDPGLLPLAEAALAVDGLDPPGATVLREVALTTPPLWPGTGPFHGIIDRLSVTPDHVRITDYKSHQTVPARAEDTPEAILRQMAAYRAALAQIYPGLRIDCAILWIEGATLMVLPDDLLQRAFAASAPP